MIPSKTVGCAQDNQSPYTSFAEEPPAAAKRQPLFLYLLIPSLVAAQVVILCVGYAVRGHRNLVAYGINLSDQIYELEQQVYGINEGRKPTADLLTLAGRVRACRLELEQQIVRERAAEEQERKLRREAMLNPGQLIMGEPETRRVP